MTGFFCGFDEEQLTGDDITHNLALSDQNSCDVCLLLAKMKECIEKVTKIMTHRNRKIIVTDKIIMLQILKLKEAEKNKAIHRKHWDKLVRQRKILR